MQPVLCLLPCLVSALTITAALDVSAQVYTFGTIAGDPTVVDSSGNPVTGYVNGTTREGRFGFPISVAANAAGTVFVADSLNNAIRAVKAEDGIWAVSTVAGGGPDQAGSSDGTNKQARFSVPQGVAVDNGGCIYVADTFNFVIRKITPVGGGNWAVTTIAGQPGTSGTNDGIGSAAQFTIPISVAVDGATNVYVADYIANTIRKLTRVGTNWAVTTIAGAYQQTGSTDGTNGHALFNGPGGLVADSAGNVYVSDWYNSTVRKISAAGANYVVTTIAGKAGEAGWVDEVGTKARFSSPLGGIGADTAGNLYVTDAGMVRKLTPSGTNWVVTTMAGAYGQVGAADGAGNNVRFHYPQAVTADSAGTLYIADRDNNAIRIGAPAVATAPALWVNYDGNHVILSWPLGAAGFALESRNSFLPGPSWTRITNSAAIADARFVLTNSIGTTNRVYRLHLSP